MFTDVSHSKQCCIIHGCTFHGINEKCPICKGEIKQSKICGRCIDDVFGGKTNLGILWQDKLMENKMIKINSIFLSKNRKIKLIKLSKDFEL